MGNGFILRDFYGNEHTYEFFTFAPIKSELDGTVVFGIYGVVFEKDEWELPFADEKKQEFSYKLVLVEIRPTLEGACIGVDLYNREAYKKRGLIKDDAAE